MDDDRWAAMVIVSIALVVIVFMATVGLVMRGADGEHHQERMVCLKMNEQANREACLRLVDPPTDR